MPPPSAGQRPVLCAVDFEASSWRALGFAVSVARQTAQPLHIVHVSDPGPEVDWDHLDPAIAPALRELEALLEARVERAHGLLARAAPRVSPMTSNSRPPCAPPRSRAPT